MIGTEEQSRTLKDVGAWMLADHVGKIKKKSLFITEEAHIEKIKESMNLEIESVNFTHMRLTRVLNRMMDSVREVYVSPLERERAVAAVEQQLNDITKELTEVMVFFFFNHFFKIILILIFFISHKSLQVSEEKRKLIKRQTELVQVNMYLENLTETLKIRAAEEAAVNDREKESLVAEIATLRDSIQGLTKRMAGMSMTVGGGLHTSSTEQHGYIFFF